MLLGRLNRLRKPDYADFAYCSPWIDLERFLLASLQVLWQLNPAMPHRHIVNLRRAKNDRRPCSRLQTAGLTQVQLLLVAIACFLAGAALTNLWLKHRFGALSNSGDQAVAGSSNLSETTRAVLQGLDKPLELKFYSLLDSPAVPEPLSAFNTRVARLLSSYQAGANGNLKLTQVTDPSYANAKAAVADGLKSFTLEKGETCFLGITVSRAGHRECVPLLAPEWETAVEPDVTRAIARLVEATAEGPAASAPQPDTAALEAVKRAIPNLESVSEQEATRQLREAALSEFSQATRDMEAAMQQAQQRLSDAQKSQSEAEQQAAMKQLQQLQAEQTEKLRQIAAKSQAQIQALQQLKHIQQ